jgi:hypothetical protein
MKLMIAMVSNNASTSQRRCDVAVESVLSSRGSDSIAGTALVAFDIRYAGQRLFDAHAPVVVRMIVIEGKHVLMPIASGVGRHGAGGGPGIVKRFCDLSRANAKRGIVMRLVDTDAPDNDRRTVPIAAHHPFYVAER